MTHTERLKRNLIASIAAKQEFLGNAAQIEIFGRAVEVVVNAYRNGGRLYIAGNGGSAADAQHLAAEFVVRLGKDRPSMPAEALTVDSSILTAIGNDYGYDEVFARQVAGKMRDHDVFLALTTSGRSPNILRALEQCRAMSLPSIVFCGRDGGQAKAMADHCVVANGTSTSTIQELHIVLAHSLCESVEAALFGG
ncbi:MAG: SIS domain-containing protein [Gammaproteobacteria bacterium]|nr:SIS domain-containing protein [Gammaproteobacteria bacterium]